MDLIKRLLTLVDSPLVPGCESGLVRQKT